MPEFNPFTSNFDPSVDPITADSHGLLTLEKLKASQDLEFGADPAQYQADQIKLRGNLTKYEKYKKSRGEQLFSYAPEVEAQGKAKNEEELARYTVNLFAAGDASFDTILKENGDYDDFKAGASMMDNDTEMRAAWSIRKTMGMFGYSDRMIDSGAAEPMFRSQIKAGEHEPTEDAIERWGLDKQNQLKRRRRIAESSSETAAKNFLGMTGDVDSFEESIAEANPEITADERTMIRRIYNQQTQNLKKNFSKVTPLVRKTFNTIIADSIEDGGAVFTDEGDEAFSTEGDAIEAFSKLSDEDFSKVISMMSETAKVHGQDVDGFMNKWSKRVERAGSNFLDKTLAGGLKRKFAVGQLKEFKGDTPLGAVFNKEGEVVFAAPLDDIDQERIDFAIGSEGFDKKTGEPTRYFRKITNNKVDRGKAIEYARQQENYLKYAARIRNWKPEVAKARSDNKAAEAWVYGLMGDSMPEMAAAATGFVGMALVSAAQYEENLSRYQERNPDMTAEQYEAADPALRLSAYTYAALNRLQWKTATKGMPTVSAYIKRIPQVLIFETVQETAQDLSYSTTLELYGAMDEDVKDLEMVKELGNAIKQFPHTMFAVAPLALVGVGGRAGLTHIKNRSFERMLKDTQLLQQYGMAPHDIEAVQKMTAPEASEYIKENNKRFLDNMKETPIVQPVTQADMTFNAETGEFTVSNSGLIIREAPAPPQSLSDKIDASGVTLGLNRAVAANPDLREVSEPDFEAQHKEADDLLDDMERRYDEGDVTLDVDEFAAAQDNFMALNLEKFRRDNTDRFNGDLFSEATDLARDLGDPTPEAMSTESGQKLQILLEIIADQGGVTEADINEGNFADMNNPDAVEVLGGKAENLKLWLEFLKNPPKAIENKVTPPEAPAQQPTPQPTPPQSTTARTAEEAAEAAQQLDPSIGEQLEQQTRDLNAPPAPVPDIAGETEVLNSFFGPDLGWGTRTAEPKIFGDERLPPTLAEGKDRVDLWTKIRYGLQSFFSQQLLPSRSLSETLLTVKNKILAAESHFTRVANKLDKTVKAHLKNTDALLRDAEGIKVQENAYLALRGDAAALAALPAEIAAQITSARADIDLYSQQLIDDGMVDGDLAKTVGDNIGSYVFRNFKAFDPNSEWKYNFVKKNEPAIYHAALKEIMDVSHAKENAARKKAVDEGKNRKDKPLMTTKEADLEIQGILGKGGAQNFYFGKSAGGKIDVTSFIKRKDLSPAMLDLLGEIRNPITNIRETGSKTSKTAITHMGQMRMRQQLAEMGLVSRGENKAKGHTYRLFQESYDYPTVNEDGSPGIGHGTRTKKKFAGFDNTFIDEVIGKEIEAAFEPKGDGQFGARGLLGKFAAAASAILKTNLVAFNPGSYMVNMFGGVATNIWNGHVFTMSPRAIKAYFKGIGTEIADVVGKGNAPVLSLNEQNTMLDKKSSEYGTADKVDGALKTELMEAGNILGSSIVANDIQRSIEVTAGESVDKFTAPFWKAYQVADNRAKRAAYEVELTKHMQARPDETLREASARAIADVRATTQNYDMVPKLLKEASTYGIFVPTFISFSVELLRNMKNTAKLTARELSSKNKVIRKAGAKRLAGQMVMVAAMTKGIEVLTEFMTGEDEEDLKKLDVFKDPWDERKNVVWTEAKNGRLSYFNPEYIIPQMAIYNALSSGFKNASDGGALNGVATAADVLGLTDDNIMMQTVVNVLSNKNNYGQEIYNETVDDFGTKMSLIGEHVRENAFTPGVVRSYKKWGKAKDEEVGYAGSTLNGTEFAVYMAGIRLRVKDTTSDRFVDDQMAQFAFTSRDISGAISKSELKAFEKDGTMGRKLSKLDPDDIPKAIKNVKVARAKEEQKIKALIEGFRYIGIEDKKIKKAMDVASVPADLRKAAVRYMEDNKK